MGAKSFCSRRPIKMYTTFRCVCVVCAGALRYPLLRLRWLFVLFYFQFCFIFIMGSTKGNTIAILFMTSMTSFDFDMVAFSCCFVVYFKLIIPLQPTKRKHNHNNSNVKQTDQFVLVTWLDVCLYVMSAKISNIFSVRIHIKTVHCFFFASINLWPTFKVNFSCNSPKQNSSLNPITFNERDSVNTWICTEQITVTVDAIHTTPKKMNLKSENLIKILIQSVKLKMEFGATNVSAEREKKKKKCSTIEK